MTLFLYTHSETHGNSAHVLSLSHTHTPRETLPLENSMWLYAEPKVILDPAMHAL